MLGWFKIYINNNLKGLKKQHNCVQAHHTATHLLQAALKKVLGADTSQAGSLVAFDRLRFDFNLPRAMTEAEVTQVESLVNDWIGMGVSLTSEEMALVAAKEKGAIAMFGEKYGEQVSLLGFFY